MELDNLDLKDYGPENNRRYRCVLVIIDNVSKYGFTSPLKNKNVQKIKDSFENFTISSKRKPKLIKSDRGKDFHNNIVQDFLKKTILNIILETHTLELFLQNVLTDLLIGPIFEKSESNWIDILSTITKRSNN